MRVQLKHIDFNPIRTTLDGQPRELLVIELQSKGEKFTGEKERVYASTERLMTALRACRDELQNNPDAYVFGTSSGFRQENFRTVWHRLFKLAGLDFGRDKGLVWHTLRHEFCSRTAENTGAPVIAQELARHKDLRTTQGYRHARRPVCSPPRCPLIDSSPYHEWTRDSSLTDCPVPRRADRDHSALSGAPWKVQKSAQMSTHKTATTTIAAPSPASMTQSVSMNAKTMRSEIP